jgi:hypothetical protein
MFITALKIIYSSIKASGVLVLTVLNMLINFVFFTNIPEMPA